MLGQTHYPRAPLDFYPTPPKCTEAFVKAIADELPELRLEDLILWEPACGNGAISKVFQPHVASILNTDIRAYEGLDPDALVNFLDIYQGAHDTSPEAIAARNAWIAEEEGSNEPIFMDEIAAFNDRVHPNAIITNPPYGDEAEKFVRRALHLMKPDHGVVSVLCRHDWDCAKGRRDIFRDHPAFLAKITLLFRPVWIEKKPGEPSASPRFSYAWYVWDWSKDPSAHPVQLYAE